VAWSWGVRLPVFVEGKIREENKERESVPRQCVYLRGMNKTLNCSIKERLKSIPFYLLWSYTKKNYLIAELNIPIIRKE